MYLISYDITSNRLRTKVAKILEGYGKRVQYSVFECDLVEKRYEELYEKLLKLTEGMEEGSICFYYICKNCQGKKQVIGVPEGEGSILQEDTIVI